MGYDMYVVDEHGEKIARSEHSYWRRNIFGGHPQAQKLVELGMASWPTTPRPDYPQQPEGTEWKYDEETGDATLVGPGAEEYRAAEHVHLRSRFGATTGIAAYKLCDTNDGWWVTVEECREALDAWGKAGRPDVDDFGRGPSGDTIPFLQLAAEHGGFRVW
jgi:hypothetical protein